MKKLVLIIILLFSFVMLFSCKNSNSNSIETDNIYKDRVVHNIDGWNRLQNDYVLNIRLTTDSVYNSFSYVEYKGTLYSNILYYKIDYTNNIIEIAFVNSYHYMCYKFVWISIYKET